MAESYHTSDVPVPVINTWYTCPLQQDLAESEERVEDEEDDDEFTRTGPPIRSYNQSRPPLASDRELVPENQNEFRQRKVLVSSTSSIFQNTNTDNFLLCDRQSSSSGSTQNHEEETVQIEHVLQHHRQLQEELTSDLGRMAAQLKSNSLAFGDMLEKDNQVRSFIGLELWIQSVFVTMSCVGAERCAGWGGK